MEGAIQFGFRFVKSIQDYKPRLFEVRRCKKNVRVVEIEVKASAMNIGDVYILDAGTRVFLFIGEFSNAFEKMKGCSVAQSIVGGRLGKAKFVPDINEEFWEILQGTLQDVKSICDEDEEEASVEEKEMDNRSIETENVLLYQLHFQQEEMKLEKIFEGPIPLNKEDIFNHDCNIYVIDCNIHIFVWIGKSLASKRNCLKIGLEYLKLQGKALVIPITRIIQGQRHDLFNGIFPKRLAASMPSLKHCNPNINSMSPTTSPPQTEYYSRNILKPSPNSKKLW
jgi:hypothetical protein